MAKFDMGAAWDDTIVLLRSHTALTGAIAAVFLFLPSLAISWFGPSPIEPADNATFDQVMAAFRANAEQGLPYQLLVALISAVGGVGILRLWLARTGTSVGDAIVFALKMIPTMIAIQVIMGVAAGLAGVVLVMPGIAAGASAIGVVLVGLGLLLFLGLCAYLWGRVSVTSPAVADLTIYNPIHALQESWRLTKDNGWRIFLFSFLVFVVILIFSLVIALIAYAAVGDGEGIGRIVSGLIEAGVAVVSGLVMLALSAAVYRQMATTTAEQTFG